MKLSIFPEHKWWHLTYNPLSGFDLFYSDSIRDNIPGSSRWLRFLPFFLLLRSLWRSTSRSGNWSLPVLIFRLFWFVSFLGIWSGSGSSLFVIRLSRLFISWTSGSASRSRLWQFSLSFIPWLTDRSHLFPDFLSNRQFLFNYNLFTFVITHWF